MQISMTRSHTLKEAPRMSSTAQHAGRVVIAEVALASCGSPRGMLITSFSKTLRESWLRAAKRA